MLPPTIFFGDVVVYEDSRPRRLVVMYIVPKADKEEVFIGLTLFDSHGYRRALVMDVYVVGVRWRRLRRRESIAGK